MENILWKKVWTLPSKYLLVNKVKEISFKLIHQYYPVKTFIVSKFKLSIDVNCTFCDSHPETVLHLFWHCVHTRKLWQDICQFIVNFIHNDFELFFKDVSFGIFTFEKQYGNIFFLFCYQQFFIFLFFHKQHNIISKIKQNKTADTYSTSQGSIKREGEREGQQEHKSYSFK